MACRCGRWDVGVCGSGWLSGAVRVLWTRVMVWSLWARSVSLEWSALGGGSDCRGPIRDPWLCGEKKTESVLSVLSVGGSESVSVGPGCAEREKNTRVLTLHPERPED